MTARCKAFHEIDFNLAQKQLLETYPIQPHSQTGRVSGSSNR